MITMTVGVGDDSLGVGVTVDGGVVGVRWGVADGIKSAAPIVPVAAATSVCNAPTVDIRSRLGVGVAIVMQDNVKAKIIKSRKNWKNRFTDNNYIK
jgi:hypothetical protein